MAVSLYEAVLTMGPLQRVICTFTVYLDVLLITNSFVDAGNG